MIEALNHHKEKVFWSKDSTPCDRCKINLETIDLRNYCQKNCEAVTKYFSIKLENENAVVGDPAGLGYQ